MSIRAIVLALPVLLASTAVARPSAMDRRFLRDAFRDNRVDENLGRLASKQGRTAGVRDFGTRVVGDHKDAQGALVRAARDSGLPVPSLSYGFRSATFHRLSALRGARFDRAYRAEIVRSHRRDVAEYQREIRTTHNAALRDYAKKTLPTLREHIAAIQAVKV